MFYITVTNYDRMEFLRQFPKFTNKLSRITGDNGSLLLTCDDPYVLPSILSRLDKIHCDYCLMEQMNICQIM